jgi:hypothetical protein
MNMARLQQTKTKEVDQKFLSVIFGSDVSKEALKKEELSKIELFEKGLANELQMSDTIEKSVEKIVKMALACEFGPSLLTKSGAKAMVATISRGILSDRELRRNALIIADRFASSKKAKVISIRGKRKNIING